MNTIKIAVLGGTGKSGKYLVQELMNRNIPIKLLLRNTSHFETENPLVEIVRGDVRDYNSIYSLFEGCDAVISTLSQPIGEESIFGDAARNVIQAMEARGIKRYIVTAGLNVDAIGDEKNEKVRFATDWMYQNYPKTTIDRQVEYELLANSRIDWTMVRLPMIIQTDERFPVEISLIDCPGENISATDLAVFLVDQLSNEEYVQKSPFVANS
ncbi:NAD(P)-dependent oxidoreductase [Fluviicola taffensis]|uniref:NAD-dependent epimerase/dehydratase n=1 Tax=Fluviicola taffensis (strain DSM 16823 / NCIMB 13979 / RW262) TaxID=755732 RepID=F2IAW9_FLUTR|nr:NAD(P)H-binding protein [Fluviicola taffensis]AEA45293.1 NAD-dependent epimerase/dehydratase [Fluviicola taffensis DSM 16823]